MTDDHSENSTLSDYLDQQFRLPLPKDNITQALRLMALLNVVDYERLETSHAAMLGHTIVLSLAEHLFREVQHIIDSEQLN